MGACSVTNHLFCFGFGFSARALAQRLAGEGWRITGTSRSAAGAEAIRRAGHTGLVFDGTAPLPAGTLSGVTHVVVSAPPGAGGDPVLAEARAGLIAAKGTIRWLAYLSTTGVYGDRAGGWVDEDSPLTPATSRGEKRLAAETAWLALWREHGLPVHLFRLAGIYGKGRNQLLSVLDGSARRIVKEGQVFSRIHVADIAGVLMASMAKPHPGRAYNVCDDEPCPPQEAVAYAATLLGAAMPPEIPFAEAQLSPMAASFYQESKRVSNARVKEELGYRFLYPSYREGLGALKDDP